MFHTYLTPACDSGDCRLCVVIPWRGFRCFTREIAERICTGLRLPVVIPWRGFRCFTRGGRVPDGDAAGVLLVVIPWRGFRCFTPAAWRRRKEERMIERCNPLAGI